MKLYKIRDKKNGGWVLDTYNTCKDEPVKTLRTKGSCRSRITSYVERHKRYKGSNHIPPQLADFEIVEYEINPTGHVETYFSGASKTLLKKVLEGMDPDEIVKLKLDGAFE
jgi:hypothetical protein